MRDPDFRRDAERATYAPHVEAINRLVDDLNRSGEGGWMPYVAASFGGVRSRALCVLQSPGPGTHPASGGSGFLCAENDDPSAELFASCLDAAGVAQADVMAWNAYPWFLGPETTLSTRHLDAGVEPLRRVLGLLPDLRLVFLMGRHAQKGWERLDAQHPEVPRSYRTVDTLLPSRRGITNGGQHSRQDGVARLVADLGKVAGLSAAPTIETWSPEGPDHRGAWERGRIVRVPDHTGVLIVRLSDGSRLCLQSERWHEVPNLVGGVRVEYSHDGYLRIGNYLPLPVMER